MLVSKVEKSIGIEVYATKSLGIGGVIRQSVDDFVVEEVLVDGSRANTNQSATSHVLGSSDVKNRYLLCTLVKRDWDTFLAINAVAKQLGIGTKQVQIAGIKDAKAVTAQHITIEDAQPEDTKRIQIKDVKINPIGYIRSKISPYFLLGNNFHITIKAISHSKSDIRKRITRTMNELESIGGVPNFFGHQRFGTTRPITHLVGKALVNENLKSAVMLFLAKPGLYEHPESKQARKQLQVSQNYKQALKDFPKKLQYERVMLRHLIKKPDDFAGAFRSLPIRLRKLFPQAYQSYLFNKFLSRRVTNGLPLNEVEVGDYVVNVERSGLPMLNMRKRVSAETIKETNMSIETGRIRLAIPLIGFRQFPSQGIQGKIEKAILEEEQISPENFKIKPMPEISSRGELRTAVAPLNNFSLDEITNDPVNPSKNQAKLDFMLYRGSYATVFLREIIKPRSLVLAGF